MRLAAPWLVWAGFFLSMIRLFQSEDFQSEHHEPLFGWLGLCMDFALRGIEYTFGFSLLACLVFLGLSLNSKERARRGA
jgi:hypothetical protein